MEGGVLPIGEYTRHVKGERLQLCLLPALRSQSSTGKFPNESMTPGEIPTCCGVAACDDPGQLFPLPGCVAYGQATKHDLRCLCAGETHVDALAALRVKYPLYPHPYYPYPHVSPRTE